MLLVAPVPAFGDGEGSHGSDFPWSQNLSQNPTGRGVAGGGNQAAPGGGQQGGQQPNAGGNQAVQQAQSLMQQALSFGQQGSQGGSGAQAAGGGEGRAAAKDGAKQAGEQARETMEKAVEETNKNISESVNNFIGGFKAPQEATLSPEFGKAISALSQGSGNSSITQISQGIIQDIQGINSAQVAQIQALAQMFTPPPRGVPPSTNKATASSTVQQQLAAFPADRTVGTPQSVFAQAMGQQPANTPPGHNSAIQRAFTGSIGAGNPAANADRGITFGMDASTLYNIPEGIRLPK